MESKPLAWEALLQRSWDRTLQAWQLLILQGLFVVATWVVILGTVMATAVPVVVKFQKDHPGFRIQDFRSADLSSLLTPAVVGALLLLAALFLVWIFLVGLFIKGGAYGRLWDQARRGVFTLNGFLTDGASLFVPLLGYQSVACLLAMAGTAPFGAVMIVVLMLGKGGHGLGALLALLLGGGFLLLVFVPLVLVFIAYLYLVLAHLTQPRGVWESFRLGWESLKASDWRGLKVLGGFLAVTFVGMLFVGGVFGILELVPVVKYVAMLGRLVFNLAVGALWAVFFPVLSIAFVQDAESATR